MNVLEFSVGLANTKRRFLLAAQRHRKKIFLLVSFSRILCSLTSSFLAAILAFFLSANKSTFILVTLPIFFLVQQDFLSASRLRLSEQELRALVKSWFYTALFATIFLVFSGNCSQLLVWFICIAAGFVLDLVGRVLIRLCLGAWENAGFTAEKVIYLSGSKSIYTAIKQIRILRIAGFQLEGCLLGNLEKFSAEEHPNSPSIFGGICDYPQILDREQPDIILIDLSVATEFPGIVSSISALCKSWNGSVELLGSALDEFSQCRGPMPSYPFSSVHQSYALKVQRFIKRLIDIIFGLAGSAIAISLYPIVWLFIQREDRGPVYFRQCYVTRGHLIGHYLKFRTMVQNAEQILDCNPELKQQFEIKQKLENDPRILHFGKTLRRYSIDEFPEFFSVLTGKLSFVGPRTISAREMDRYGDNLDKLLTATPGLTGLWQMSGRQTTSYEDRVAMDMYYIDHWSIWLDLVIISKTFCSFFSQVGAY